MSAAIGARADRCEKPLRRQSSDTSAALRFAFVVDRWVCPEQASIALAVDESGITLTGTVDQLAVKRRAAALARLLSTGRPVVDCVRRRSVRVLADAEMARIAAERLAGEAVLSDCGLALALDGGHDVYRQANAKGHLIRLAVEGRSAILTGTVASLCQYRMAEVLMWRIDSCEFVHNRLQLSRPRRDSDDEINKAVQLCLENIDQIDASQLSVQTAAAIVQIEGLLKDPAQRPGMLQGVWAVPGVWDVDDCTQTAS